MLKVKLECRNVRMDKIAGCFERSRKLPFGYKIWLYDGRIFAYFKIKSFSDLKQLTKRLKRMKNIRINLHRIEEGGSWLRRIKFNPWKN